ncbi:MAG TPA: hypothetical protein VI932_04220, partial [Bacteroidota bacterium]|nr:hypothetical protein [Bacteroidota bacterium]
MRTCLLILCVLLPFAPSFAQMDPDSTELLYTGYLMADMETPVDRDLTGPEPYFSLVGDTVYPVSVVRNHASAPRLVIVQCNIFNVLVPFPPVYTDSDTVMIGAMTDRTIVHAPWIDPPGPGMEGDALESGTFGGEWQKGN